VGPAVQCDLNRLRHVHAHVARRPLRQYHQRRVQPRERDQYIRPGDGHHPRIATRNRPSLPYAYLPGLPPDMACGCPRSTSAHPIGNGDAHVEIVRLSHHGWSDGSTLL
jgi:hypothetical protein